MRYVCVLDKEYIKRGLIEPVKFLFLPRVGLLGSQPRKMNYGLILRAAFFVFSCAKTKCKISFFYNVISAPNVLKTKVRKNL